jgi:hypothetical protein
MQRELQKLVEAREAGKIHELPEFIQEWISWGRRDGKLEGFHDGKLEGFHDGKLEALRENILRGARRRGIALTAEQQTRIQDCSDRKQLDRWFDNLFDGTTGEDVFR